MADKFDERVSLSESATRFIKKRVSDVSPTLDSDDDSPYSSKLKMKPTFATSVVAGGIAGVTVDITLYPLDTIKTRLQSRVGFAASGGFRGIYKGVVPVLLCSAPLSALFFATYNTFVNLLRSENTSLNPVVYVVSATASEVITSVFRVPLEVVKQRKQTSDTKSTYIIKKTLEREGWLGLYRGFWSTLLREIPFAAIQYPLWEMMIQQFILLQNGRELTALETAYCGAAAGAIAAVVTTPMDVIKTRIMLEEKDRIDKMKKHLNYNIVREVIFQRGITGLFAGVIPRVLWITLGGFLYFGAYEKSKIIFEENCKLLGDRYKKVRDIAPCYLDEKIDRVVFSNEERCSLELGTNTEICNALPKPQPEVNENDHTEELQDTGN
ncbi:hypothetical protein RUM44_001511 [Polyplax serrata]|uniref:S-adenosylmethionine mitochondrial carrier protein n=1 Tax=Polyplax serrata TaxID=468196 RepID=A0ABR1AK83_POLSC